MSVVITLEDIQAYAEVDYIINHMNQKYIDKVPEKLKSFFHDYKDPNMEVKINPYVPLQNQGLKRFTLEIIALLHLKYWCEDEKRKQELYDLMVKNQQKIEDEIREKYSVEHLFDGPAKADLEDEEKPDFSKEDFTKPRTVQRYSQYAETNDIQDFTDTVETAPQEEKLPANSVEEAKGIFQKLKEKILSFLKLK